jgi:hypothetical protein
MNLVVKYAITGAANTAQLPNDGTLLGITGTAFVGAEPAVNMILANTTAANNSHKATILPAVDKNSKGTYVDKIVAISVPNIDGTTKSFMSVTLANLGINSDIVGVEFIGLNRTEAANTAAFANHLTVRNSISFSVSKNRLIIDVLAAVNAISGSIMNLRVTYKN